NTYLSPTSFNVIVTVETATGIDYQCSGALIDPKIILLSGSCLFDTELYGDFARATNLIVRPAYDVTDGEVFGVAESEMLYAYNQWIIERDFEHNVGIAVLDRPIGATVGFFTGSPDDASPWLQLTNEPDANYLNNTFVVEGYPRGEEVETGRLYRRSGSFDDVEQFVTYTDLNSLQGESGSVAYTVQNGRARASAVLSHRRGNSTGFARVTPGKFAELNNLIDFHTPDEPDLYALPMPLFPAFTNKQQDQGTLLDTLVIGVTNYGASAFSGRIEWRVFISNDETPSEDDITLGNLSIANYPLAPKETQYFLAENLLGVPDNLPDGQYFIGTALIVNDANQENNVPLLGDLRPIQIGATPAPTVSCADAIPIDCGTTFTYNNNTSTNRYDNSSGLYNSCFGNGNTDDIYAGNELVFSLELSAPENISINITNLQTRYDLFVFQSCADGVLSNCAGASIQNGFSNERIDLAGAQGTYYIVVDAQEVGNIGAFDIRIDGVCSDPCEEATPIICGETYTGSTIGGNSVFTHANYDGMCVERLSAVDNPFDAPDQFFRLDLPPVERADIVLSGLNADLDLFLFEQCANGSLSRCTARSITFGNLDETIALENVQGTYYLVVDGYQSDQQSDFTLEVSCVAAPSDAAAPNICDMGGDFISNRRNRLYDLEINPVTDFPLTAFERSDCILDRFGGNIPADYHFDAYVFYLEDDKAADGFGIELYDQEMSAFLFTCEVDASGQLSAICIDATDEFMNSFDFIPAEGDNAGFYYIVVAGPAGRTYDLGILPEGPCGSDGLVLREDDYERVESLNGFGNDFSRNGGVDIFSCYDGNELYNGEDVVYQFEIKVINTTINFDIEAADPNEKFGLFIYDYLCGGECIAYAETENGVGSVSTTFFNKGIYYLVVDKARAGGNQNYTLNIPSGSVFGAFTTNYTCSEENLHEIIFSENVGTIGHSEYIAGGEVYFAYYYPKEGDDIGLASVSFDAAELGRSTGENGEKCGFEEGDPIIIRMDDQQGIVYDLKPVFAPRLDGTPSDEVYRIGGLSVIDSLIPVKLNQFQVSPKDRSLNFSNKSFDNMLVMCYDPWEITGPDWLTFIPSSGDRPRPVRVILKNNAPSVIEDERIKITRLKDDPATMQDDFVFNERYVGLTRDAEFLQTAENRQADIFSNIILSPNPAQDHFNIQMIDDDQIEAVQIFDCFGKLVQEQFGHPDSGIVKVETDGLVDGIYLVKVLQENRITTQKVSVSR
ncbi:MAG: pre-peptidase C-terminal domain-containing protein, partial [Bacteroidota bacterium]